MARRATQNRRGGRRRALRRLALPAGLLLVISAAPSTPAQPGPPDAISDQETVFVEMDPSGAVERRISVDWLRVTANGRVRLVDSAPGADPKTLAGTPPPQRVDGTLVWEIDVDGTTDLFMTGEPDLPLPIETSLRYFVDGRQVPPEEAQGAAGRVRVEGTFRNVTEPYIPLVANVNFSLPVASFRNLDKGAATAVAVGRRVQLAYILTPKREATFHFEIDTGRAQLPQYTVTVLPQTLDAAPLVATLAELQETLGGLRSSGGLADLQSGAAGLQAGAGLGAAGARRLDAALQGPDLDQIGRQLVAGLPPKERGAALALGRQARAAAHEKTERLSAALAHGAEAVKQELSKLNPPPELRKLMPAPGGSAVDLEGLLRSLGRVGQAGGGLRDLITGLARVQSAAAQLQSALRSLDTEAFEQVLAELEGAGAGLPTEEELQRAQAYDTFTGKPEGASGQVRFVYQISEPVRVAEPADRQPTPEPTPRPWWRRLIGLIPGVD